MHSQKERSGFDADLTKALRKLASVDVRFGFKDETIHPINTTRPGFLYRQLQCIKTLKTTRVFMCHAAFSRHNFVYALQLSQREGGLEISQPKIETQLLMKEASLRLKAKISTRAQFFGKRDIVG